jgi:pimeloyl-ACP methyl ester carboxylesterase
MTPLPTFVLLHAFPLSSVIYEAQHGAFAGLADVLTPDFRGFGTAPIGDDPPSLDTLADDVVRLLDERGVDRAVVGGTSMGGYVTMSLLRRHPHRVEAALLANTKASADTPEARDNRLRIADTVADLGVTEALSGMLPKLIGASTRDGRPDLLERVDRLAGSAAPEAVAWAQRAMDARPESYDALAGFPRQVLVIAGSEDELMPLAEAEAMAAAAPSSRLEVLPAAGHLACLETPELWNRVVTDWLRST